MPSDLNLTPEQTSAMSRISAYIKRTKPKLKPNPKTGGVATFAAGALTLGPGPTPEPSQVELAERAWQSWQQGQLQQQAQLDQARNYAELAQQNWVPPQTASAMVLSQQVKAIYDAEYFLQQQALAQQAPNIQNGTFTINNPFTYAPVDTPEAPIHADELFDAMLPEWDAATDQQKTFRLGVALGQCANALSVAGRDVRQLRALGMNIAAGVLTADAARASLVLLMSSLGLPRGPLE